MNVSDLKDSHKGQRCFILGNGSSLNLVPFLALESEWTFATNLISGIFERVRWRPNFYAMGSDGYWIPEYQGIFDRALKESKAFNFVGRHLQGSVVSLSKNIYLEMDGKKPGWSDFPETFVHRWGTTAIVNFQMAAFMGFKIIYIMGFDLGFEEFELGNDTNHFSKNYWGKYQHSRRKDNDFWSRMNRDHLRAHKIIYENCQRLNIEVFNLTPSKHLRLYPEESIINVFR